MTITFDRGPGVYINELQSPVHSIVGVPTSVAAFVGRAPGGAADDPVQVNSWSDFERSFGGLDSAFPLTYAVYLFFLNGGSVAQVVRTLSGNETRAQLRLSADITLEAKSAGSAGNSLSAQVDTNVPPAPGQTAPGKGFNLTVTDGSTVERYAAVPLDGSLATLLKRSKLVQLAAKSKATKAPAEGTYVVPDKDTTTTPAGGNGGADPAAAANGASPAVFKDGAPGGAGPAADNAADLGDEASATGMYALARADIFNMLCLPSPTGAGYTPDKLAEAAKFCERHRAMLIVDPPSAWPADAPLDFTKAATGAALNPPSPNAAVYYPNLTVSRGAGEDPVVLGPSGAVAGVWAATDAARGVWKAPAGTRATIGGVSGLQVQVGDKESGVLNPLAINVIRSLPLAGTVVWGARTTVGLDAFPDQWKYLPVRRTALFLEESLYRGTRWVVFEPNDEPLWASIRLNVGTFMNSLFRQGAFQGSTPQEAYLVKCDKDNNPQDQIDLGIVNILVGFAPLKPAEFVLISIQQQTGQL